MPSRLARYLILPGLLPLSLVACQRSDGRLSAAAIRPIAPSGSLQRITGLRASVDTARRTGEPVRLLTVHGMLTDSTRFSRKWQEQIAQALGLVAMGSEDSLPIARGYRPTIFVGPQPFDSIHLDPSLLRVTTWADPASQRPILVAYELSWFPARDRVKRIFLACFENQKPESTWACPRESAAPNRDRRAWASRKLKEKILVGGLSDASIVLGGVGDVFRDDVSLAMCHIARDAIVLNRARQYVRVPIDTAPLRRRAPEERCDLADLVPTTSDAQRMTERSLADVPVFTITHSLGSFLVLDRQARAARQRADTTEAADLRREAAAFALLDSATVFMFANQVSLLQLARFAVGCTPDAGTARCPNRALPKTDSLLDERLPLSTMTRYVAFNDVNDLLGFELPPYLATVGLSGPLVNVSVKNGGRTWLWALKDPVKAHTQHYLNAAVIDALINGIPLEWPPWPPGAPRDQP